MSDNKADSSITSHGTLEMGKKIDAAFAAILDSDEDDEDEDDDDDDAAEFAAQKSAAYPMLAASKVDDQSISATEDNDESEMEKEFSAFEIPTFSRACALTCQVKPITYY